MVTAVAQMNQTPVIYFAMLERLPTSVALQIVGHVPPTLLILYRSVSKRWTEVIKARLDEVGWPTLQSGQLGGAAALLSSVSNCNRSPPLLGLLRADFSACNFRVKAGLDSFFECLFRR